MKYIALAQIDEGDEEYVTCAIIQFDPSLSRESKYGFEYDLDENVGHEYYYAHGDLEDRIWDHFFYIDESLLFSTMHEAKRELISQILAREE